MDKEVIIEAKDVWYEYPDGTWALRGVDLKIYENDFLAVIGQNGCGKTTLVKLFNGLLKPTRGVVRVFGMNTKEVPVEMLSRKVGYVFQNPMHQMFCDTVRKEVAFGPKSMGLSEDEVTERVNQALELMGIKHLEKTHPWFTSMGEKQRIAIASVLAMKPRVIILDEPTSGQDSRNCRRLMDLIRKLHVTGHTIILISHDMRVVADNAKRVVVMSDGKILLEGSTKEVFSNIEILEQTFLQPPQITRLFQAISYGRLPSDIVTVDEALRVLRDVINSEFPSRYG